MASAAAASMRAIRSQCPKRPVRRAGSDFVIHPSMRQLNRLEDQLSRERVAVGCFPSDGDDLGGVANRSLAPLGNLVLSNQRRAVGELGAMQPTRGDGLLRTRLARERAPIATSECALFRAVQKFVELTHRFSP
ncbi:hypothetical protein AB2L57_09525 [Microbacterium sp. HA-8]|uniref:hypothetical protein n=1 Tax=Microbacterium sp. HA-8 TaxID=3234200 RepID=UPI0038F678AB